MWTYRCEQLYRETFWEGSRIGKETSTFVCMCSLIPDENGSVLQERKGRVQVDDKQHGGRNRQARRTERNVFTRRRTNVIVLISLFQLLNQHTLVAGNLGKTKKYKHENHW